MTYPYRPGATASADHVSRVPATGWTVRRAGHDAAPAPDRSNVPMRRCEIMALDPRGELVDKLSCAPATPLFESAFAAMAHGSLVATEDGPIAVEDLMPGTLVATRFNGLQRLLWRGSITLSARGNQNAALYRVPMDSFGPGRPMPDLMLGPHARLLHRSPSLRALVGDDTALVPLKAFEDGQTLIRVAPVSPVRVFHLGFAGHEIISVNGIDMESFHPAPEAAARMSQQDLDTFLDLFPHVSGLGGFGPLALPRISAEACDMLAA